MKRSRRVLASILISAVAVSACGMEDDRSSPISNLNPPKLTTTTSTAGEGTPPGTYPTYERPEGCVKGVWATPAKFVPGPLTGTEWDGSLVSDEASSSVWFDTNPDGTTIIGSSDLSGLGGVTDTNFVNLPGLVVTSAGTVIPGRVHSGDYGRLTLMPITAIKAPAASLSGTLFTDTRSVCQRDHGPGVAASAAVISGPEGVSVSGKSGAASVAFTIPGRSWVVAVGACGYAASPLAAAVTAGQMPSPTDAEYLPSDRQYNQRPAKPAKFVITSWSAAPLTFPAETTPNVNVDIAVLDGTVDTGQAHTSADGVIVMSTPPPALTGCSQMPTGA